MSDDQPYGRGVAFVVGRGLCQAPRPTCAVQPIAGCPACRLVGTMCGAHAQVLSAAELSIGLRIAGITRTDVQEALWTEHSLVKTFGLRGTIHLLPTEDLPLWTGALSAIPSSSSSHPEHVRLTPGQTDEIVE